MRRILFVVTTRENMGDLALCEEWIADLGRDGVRFAFVIASGLARYLDPADEQFWFSPELDVGETIAAATARFAPDAIVLATGAFWTIPDQAGAVFGRYPEQLFGLGIPVLSFDPFEGGFTARVASLGRSVDFPAVPAPFWSLRFMTASSAAPNARHYLARTLFARARASSREALFRAVGADPAKPTVIFPVSRNRYTFISQGFPGYYAHLARIFADERLRGVQYLVVSPTPVAEFVPLADVVYVPHVRYETFLSLVGASDVYLSDSLISSMVTGLQLAVPVLVLTASAASERLAPGTFLADRFFPFRVFPYGFTEVCDELVERFAVGGCFVEAEVLDTAASAAALASLLFDASARGAVIERCRDWHHARATLPGPRETLDAIAAPRVPAP